VILAASAINSPKLLMLSGIGPAAHLAEHGIEVVADRPGVGRTCRITWSSTSRWRRQPVSLTNTGTSGARPVGRALAVHQDRPGRVEPVRKLRLHPLARRRRYPDIQFISCPSPCAMTGKAAAEGHGFQAHVGPMRSPSRGAGVTLRSADPAEAP
jgi:choline dehydrogenase